MDKWIEKGDVLIEALPYIQRFNRKIINTVVVQCLMKTL